MMPKRRTRSIALRVTEAEWAELSRMAGPLPLATYLRRLGLWVTPATLPKTPHEPVAIRLWREHHGGEFGQSEDPRQQTIEAWCEGRR